ncbi:MAG TPA: acyltransferase [Rhizomicrobium sp.]
MAIAGADDPPAREEAARPSSAQLGDDFSGFLDFLRIASALAVFVAHLCERQLGTRCPAILPDVAHQAVMVFFVLSGYLISWTAERDGTARVFAISRISRIYTVAIPALLLTWLIDVSVSDHDTLVRGYQVFHPWKYLPLFLTFSTDFWFLREDAFSNVPYWSLCYEVWYYVLFGILFFASGRARNIAVALVLLLVGPRLWLLFPVWLLGVWVQSLHRRVLLSVGTAVLLLVLSLVLIAAFNVFGVGAFLGDQFNLFTGGLAKTYLRYSRGALGDWLFAGFVALAIFSAKYANLRFFARARNFLAAGSSISFSLYLTHFPLLQAFNTIWPRPEQVWLVGGAALVGSILFGVLIEYRSRDVRSWLTALWPTRAATQVT